MNNTPASPQPRQKGSVLIIAVLLLLAVSVLSFTVMRIGGFEERMAYNQRDHQLAFQAAEATLRDAEAYITANTNNLFNPLQEGNFPDQCAAGLCRSTLENPAWRGLADQDWADQSATTLAYGAASKAEAIKGLAQVPRFLIEYQGTVDPIDPGKVCVAMFLITTRSTGANPNTVVTLQTHFRERIGTCQSTL